MIYFILWPIPGLILFATIIYEEGELNEDILLWGVLAIILFPLSIAALIDHIIERFKSRKIKINFEFLEKRKTKCK